MKLSACLAIKRFVKNNKVFAYLADKVILCHGQACKNCQATEIMEREKGLNALMSEMNITIRQDEQTKRPRINKLNSVMDKEQKSQGMYFHVEKRNYI
jgi:ATP-binding cassette subfamily E protein 1